MSTNSSIPDLPVFVYSRAAGPNELGVLLSALFYGAFLAYLYLTTYTRELLLNKLVVIFVLICTTADIASSILRIYRITVTHGGDVSYILNIAAGPETWLGNLFENITSITCQAFVAYRTIAFAKAMKETYSPRTQKCVTFLPAVMCIAWVNSMASGLSQPIWVSTVRNATELLYEPQRTLYGIFTFWQPMAFTVMDILITIVISLEVGAAKTGFGGSNAVLSALMGAILRNGVLVMALQVAQIALVASLSPFAQLVIPLISKIHAITLICVLTQPKMAQAKYFADIDPSSNSGGLLSMGTSSAFPHQNHCPCITNKMPTTSMGIITVPTTSFIAQPSNKDSVNYGLTTESTTGSTKCSSCGSVTLINGIQPQKELSVVLNRESSNVPVSFKAALEGLWEDDGSDLSDQGQHGLRSANQDVVGNMV